MITVVCGAQLSGKMAAWLAGLIDGEGSVMLTNRRQESGGRPANWRPTVNISNTDYRLMSALLERMGGGVVYTHHRPERENHKKVAYTWRMRIFEQRLWIPECLPWLVCKREQAVLLLEALELKTRLTCGKGQKQIPKPEQLACRIRMAEIADEISRLNRKGRHVTNVVSQESC